ncbi:unnamed protein product [Moneuplotes crassus]|uniref:Uncharacterized protein n=1 Tax=Euplotes crassus TaxID=5936 RepID=A0AAD1Y378_EUPCR|nr:unnamed protein product [Moneuplotes crassus]
MGNSNICGCIEENRRVPIKEGSKAMYIFQQGDGLSKYMSMKARQDDILLPGKRSDYIIKNIGGYNYPLINEMAEKEIRYQISMRISQLNEEISENRALIRKSKRMMDFENKENLKKEKQNIEMKRDRLKELKGSLSKIKERYRHHIRYGDSTHSPSESFHQPIRVKAIPSLEGLLREKLQENPQDLKDCLRFDSKNKLIMLCFMLNTAYGVSFFHTLMNYFITYEWILPKLCVLRIWGIDQNTLEQVRVLLSEYLPSELKTLDLRCSADQPQHFKMLLTALRDEGNLKINSVNLGSFKFITHKVDKQNEGENLARETIEYFARISERLEFSHCLFQCDSFTLDSNIDYTLATIDFNRCIFKHKRKIEKSPILTFMKAFNNDKFCAMLESIRITDETLTIDTETISKSISWKSEVFLDKEGSTLPSFG